MPPDRKQISVWINAESASLLSSIAKEQGQPLARIIELAIAAYSTSDRTSGKTSDYTSDQTSMQLVDRGLRDTVEDLRELIADQDVRLNALECAVMTGLEAGSGKVRITLQPAELAPVDAVEAIDDASSHPADSLPTTPEFNQDKDQFRAEAVKLYRQGIIGSPDILRILYERGFRNSKGNEYYRNDVRNALKDAGLVE